MGTTFLSFFYNLARWQINEILATNAEDDDAQRSEGPAEWSRHGRAGGFHAVVDGRIKPQVREH